MLLVTALFYWIQERFLEAANIQYLNLSEEEPFNLISKNMVIFQFF